MKKQFGAALITALFVMAVCAALATAIAVSQRSLINEALLAQTADQLTLMARGGVDWGLETLMQPPNYNSDSQLTHGADYLADQPFVLAGVKIEGIIFPQEALFNLNALTSVQNEQYFLRLLQIVIPSLSSSNDNQLAQNLYEWISVESAGVNNDDDYYEKLDPPYRVAHLPFAQKSELRLVKGFTADIYNQLAPYVTALPLSGQIQIDVNYAPAPLLMLLSNKLTLDQANAMVACRTQVAPFQSVDAFIKMCGGGAPISTGNLATVQDQFYLLRGVATEGDQAIQLDNMVQFVTDNTGKAGKFVTIWQAINSN